MLYTTHHIPHTMYCTPQVSRDELMATLGKSSGSIRSDKELRALERDMGQWLDEAQGSGGIGFGRGSADGALGFGEFCRSMRKLGEWDEARGVVAS